VPPWQSAPVPVCSRPVAVSDEPPRPTQKAADDLEPLVHVVTGTFHVPVTLVN
jgi:hypothetical protein